MHDAPEPDDLEIARTVATARLVLGGEMNLQAPPNLNPTAHRLLLRAGINDWGGISPLTADYVNPEAPWPHVAKLATTCARTASRCCRGCPSIRSSSSARAFSIRCCVPA